MKIYAPIAFLLFLFGCNQPSPSSKGPAQADSATAVSIPIVDTSTGGLKKMLGYFRTRESGGIDQDAEIDKEYMIKIFHDSDMQWNSISAINPLAVTRNVYGTFFIVKLHCGSGGFCEEFYLIGFNGEHPVPPEEIGSHMADADFERTFDYRISGDSAILVTTKNYDESEKRKDSSVSRFPLRIQHDSLMAPTIN